MGYLRNFIQCSDANIFMHNDNNVSIPYACWFYYTG